MRFEQILRIGSSRRRRYIELLEIRALQKWGFKRNECWTLSQGFARSDNLGFAFHFTTIEGARGILRDGAINKTESGPAGPGVYAGCTSTPSILLKTLPFLGFGLFFSPVRVPIDLVRVSQLARGGGEVDLYFPVLPLRALVIRLRDSALRFA